MSSNVKAVPILALASFLPALVDCALDPGFAFFVAPFLFLFCAVFSLFLWFVLKWCKCPERIRYGVIFSGIILWSSYIGFSAHHTYTAEGRFERLLLDPIPSSVRFIDTEGWVAMAGGYEIIVFSISPSDLDLVLKAGDFKPDKLNTEHPDGVDQHIIDMAKRHTIDVKYAYKSGDLSFLMLVTNESRDKALLYRFRM